jgi:hypothetical protein
MATPRRIGVLAAAAALALTPAAALSATKVLHGHSGPLSVTFTPPPTHTPKINTNVWITVAATLNGKPVKRATAKYVFLFSGTPVSTQYPRNNKHFTFNGSFRDNLVFPASAVGEPLTVRFVIGAGGRTVSFNWAITAKK